LDSGADTENITLSRKFITDKNNYELDVYAILNRNDNTTITTTSYNRTPPIVCLVLDTFWLFTSENGGTVEYNTRETWIDLFAKRYPEIYKRPMDAYTSKYL
jgi:hypothetical protein